MAILFPHAAELTVSGIWFSQKIEWKSKVSMLLSNYLEEKFKHTRGVLGVTSTGSTNYLMAWWGNLQKYINAKS